jgi:hypothetical protein
VTRVWLLDLDLGGRVVRLSTQPVSVDGAAYEGTLDRVALRESIEGLGTMPSEREAQIGLVPGALLTPYVGQRGRGVLRLWTGRGRGRVELDGSVLVSDVGGATEGLSLTLTADPYIDTASTHAEQARVASPTTWLVPRASAQGQWYPRIFGVPGASYGETDAFQLRTMPLPVVEIVGTGANAERANKLMICDAQNHAAPLRVDVTAVSSEQEDVVGQVFGAADPGPAPQLATDELGRAVWVLDVSGQSGPFRRADSFFGVILDQQAVAYSRSGVAPVDTLGAMVWQLARESSVPIDDAEWARLSEALPYRIGYALREPQPPLEVVLDVLAALPVAIYATPRGLGALVWPYDATRSQAVARLVEGETCSRRSGLVSLRRPGDEAGVVVVEYAYDERQQRPARTAYNTRNVRAAVDLPRTSTDVWVRTAEPGEAVQVIEAPYLWDDAGALEVARWAARRQALGATRLDLDVDADLADALLLGSVVLVDVPSLGVRDQVGIIAGRTLSDSSSWEMSVVLLSQVGLARQTVPTGSMPVAPIVVLDDPQNPPDPPQNPENPDNP